jgi:D-alanine transaminase
LSRIVYLNGAYLPARGARVGVEDRGFLFADGVYEVWGVRGGQLLDARGHFDRLKRSLRELEIRSPLSETALTLVLCEVLRRNRLRDGMLYLQITRGEAPRDFVFPAASVPPTIMIMAKPLDLVAQEKRAQAGVAVSVQPDIRWGRCDIKSVSLLPNVLAKESAKRAGAHEALLVDRDGLIAEGASSSFWIVSQDGCLRTRDLGANILPGVTRAALIALAQSRHLLLEEGGFSVAQAQGAREAFLTSASAGVMPVIQIDGAMIGDGRPGALTSALRAAYLEANAMRIASARG